MASFRFEISAAKAAISPWPEGAWQGQALQGCIGIASAGGPWPIDAPVAA